MSEDTSAITLTIKIDGGASMPWIVLRSDNPAQAQQQLDAIAAGGLADSLGRAHSAVNAAFQAGLHLSARTEAAPAPQQAPQAPQQAAPAWGAPQDQPQWSQPQPGMQQPAQNYAQAAANGYQQPQQAAPQQYQPPQQEAPVPGAPMIAGMPAKLVKGNKNGRDWQAWADPRPKEVTQNLPKTDDPNDPRINQGLASYWQWIR